MRRLALLAAACAAATPHQATTSPLRGAVRDAHGAPLAGVTIVVTTLDGHHLATTLTDQDGDWGVPVKAYPIRVTAYYAELASALVLRTIDGPGLIQIDIDAE